MRSKILSVVALLLVSSTTTFAHTGSGTRGFSEGLTHPLTGLDHLLAMLAIGTWAALSNDRNFWRIPLTFLASLVIGLTLGVAGFSIPGTELLIALSVITLGALIALKTRATPTVACAFAAGCAFFHGLAHGAELPTTASPTTFAFGMIAATASLHLLGAGIGSAFKQSKQISIVRFTGVAVASLGLLIALQWI